MPSPIHSQQAVPLQSMVAQILEEHFGKPAKDFGVLLLSGAMAIENLPGIDNATIKVMTQHSLIDSSTPPVYKLNLDNCLKLPRIPKYVNILEDLYGKAGGEVVRTLAIHGTLTKDQLLELVKECTSTILHRLIDDGFLEKTSNSRLRINHPGFTSLFNRRTLVQYCTSKLDPSASTLLESFIKYSGNSGLLESEVYNLETRPALSRSRIRSAINELLNSSPPLLESTRIPERGSVLVVNSSLIIDELKLNETQALITSKFGVYAARIFRFLSTKLYLEEKQISEFCLISEVKTRESLHLLMNGGYVKCQEVAKGVDRHPLRTLFLWGLCRSDVFTIVLSGMYKAWVNLKLRIANEHHREASLIQKVNRIGSIEDHVHEFTESETRRWTAYISNTERLESALNKLDDSIMLFRDL